MDDTVAFAHYEQAANLGNVDALVNLGIMLYTGRGCKKNVDLAVEAWTSAAKRHHAVACTELAKHILRTERSRGTKSKKSGFQRKKKNWRTDAIWGLLETAARQNHTPALELLQLLVK